MTLIFKLDLNIVKLYLYTKNEVPSYSSSKVIALTDRRTETQTDRQPQRQTHNQTQLTEIITYPHTLMVIT